MENLSAKVVLRQSWNNLVDLPSNTVSLLYNASVSPQEVIVELMSESREKSYVGWSGMNSNAPMTVGIDPVTSRALDLNENQLVTMNVLIQNPKSSQISLEPENVSDWELVELHAAYIESKLIEQTRCVAVNQRLIVYPTKTSSVSLHVKDIGMNQPYALIDPFAEVSIAPKKHEKKSSTSSQSEQRTSQDEHLHIPSLLKRGISTPNPLFCVPNSIPSGYEIYGNAQEFTAAIGHCEFVSVSIIPGPTSKLSKAGYSQTSVQRDVKESEKYKASTVISESKQIVAKFVNFTAAPSNTVGLSEKLAIALNVEKCLGYKVIVKQPPKSSSKKLSTLIVHPFSMGGKKVEAIGASLTKKLQAEYAQKIAQTLFPEKGQQISPLSNFCRIPRIPIYLPHGGILVFKRNDDPHAWTKPYQLNSSKSHLKIELGETISRPVLDLQEMAEEPELAKMYGVDSLLNELKEHFSTFKSTGVMIHGTQGCGKSNILKQLEKKVMDDYGVFTKYVACEALMNENSDQLRSRMKKWSHEAVWNQPSVIILDNLDKVLSAEVENSDSSQSNQLTEFFVGLMRSACSQKTSNVSVLISGSSKESFNKLLGQSHLIEKYYHMGAPDKTTRATILNKYLSNHLSCKLTFDLMDIVSETEGYLPNDLKVLSDRMYFESLRDNHRAISLSKDSDSTVEVLRTDFEAALRGFKPSSLRGVKLERSGTHWEDIGGMCEAKRVLLETLEWPTKYAPIFSNCPLRLRSGLLLYGYPGCGKTLLASAIAGQCGLNFISIKGPEILNKYIGASEQSVRELFERAQSAKPCILFFDEFDSIAPKRGHDSTGVTDRVVNQMLTQMDGAEGLDGVYVLAATSRPDLIDSALLRPGRLDKSIFCDMPEYGDRLNILACICEKMHLSSDVQLEAIASKTGGFSGADLQGLGYNAYLKAVHEKLTNEENLANGKSTDSKKSHDFFLINSEKLRNKIRAAENVAISQQIESLAEKEEKTTSLEATSETRKAQVWIKQSHFLDSLKESKSSISASEKTKLHKIYSEFSTARDGDMPDGSASRDVGGRTTLM